MYERRQGVACAIKKRLIENVGRLNGLSATKKDTQKIKPSADEDFMIAAQAHRNEQTKLTTTGSKNNGHCHFCRAQNVKLAINSCTCETCIDQKLKL